MWGGGVELVARSLDEFLVRFVFRYFSFIFIDRIFGLLYSFIVSTF